MSDPKRTTSTRPISYTYTIGGEAYGVPHEPGDPVSDKVPEVKLREWLAAGVIKRASKQKEK